MANKIELIRNGALSDLEAAAELHKRQAQFAADCDLLPELRSRGIAILDTALNTDLQAALQIRQPLVLLLRRTVEALGALYLENERCKATTCEVSDRQDSTHTQDHEAVEAMTIAIEAAPEEPIELDDGEEAKTSKVRAAIAARRKRRLLTHGKTRAKAATTGLLKPIRRAQVVKSPQPFTSTSPVSKRTARSKPTPAHVATKPRLLVKLHIPKMFEQQAEHAKKSKRSYNGRIRAYKDRIKSEEFVHDDVQEDIAMQHVDEIFDATPRKEPRLLQLEDPPRRSTRSSAATTTPPSTQDSPANPRTRASPTESSAGESSTTSTSLSQSSSTSPDLSITPSDNDTRPKRKLRTHSPTFRTTHINFPTFPSLKRERRRPFYLGASIALENILDDHFANPSETILELIEELEENRPVFSKEDWEHRSVLKGGEWVFDVLKTVIADWKEGENGGKKRDGADEIVEVVGELEDWVEKEWDRIGGRKAAEEAEERERMGVGSDEDENDEDEMSMYVRDSE